MSNQHPSRRSHSSRTMRTRRTTQPRARITHSNSNLDEGLRSYITEASAATRSVKDDWKRLSSQHRPQQSQLQSAKTRRQAATSAPPKQDGTAGSASFGKPSVNRAIPDTVRRGSVRGADGVWRAASTTQQEAGGAGPTMKTTPVRRRNAPPAAPSSGKGVRGGRGDRASSADNSRPAVLQRRGTQQALQQQKRAYAAFDGRTSASNMLDFGGPSYTISGSGDPAVDGEYKDAGERRGRRMYRRATDVRTARAMVLWCDGDTAQISPAQSRAERRRSSAAQAHATNHHNVWYVSRVGEMLPDGHFSSSEHLYESTHGAPSPAGLNWIGLSSVGATPPVVSHTKVHSVPATPHSPTARALPGNTVDGPVVKLNWLPADGGRDFDIKSYEVRMRKAEDTDSSSWLTLALPLVPTDTFADITIGLEEGCQYEFAIRASNRWGLSMWSESTVVETRTARANDSFQAMRTRGRTIAEHAKPQAALGGGLVRETREEKRRSRSPEGRNRAHRSDARQPSSAKGKELQRQRRLQRNKARQNAPRVNGVADGSTSSSRLFQHTASSHATASRQLQKSHDNADISGRDQRQRTAQLNSTRRARRERNTTRSRSGSRSRSPTRSIDGASIDSADRGAASTIVEGDDETEVGEDEMEARVRTSSKGGVLGDGLVEVTFQHKIAGRDNVQRDGTAQTGAVDVPQAQFAHRKQSASAFLEFTDAPVVLKAAPKRLAVKSKPPPKAAEFGMSSAQVASSHSLGSPHVGGNGPTQQEALDAWASGLSNVGRGGAVGGGVQWSPMKAQKSLNASKKTVSPTKRSTVSTDRVNGWSSVSRQMMSQWPVFDHDVLDELAPDIDPNHDNIDLSMSREAAAASTTTSSRDLLATSVRFDVAENTDETFTPHTVLTRLLPRTPGSGGGLRSSAIADATHRQRGRFAVDFVIESCVFDIGVGVISASQMRRQGHAMAGGASHDRSSTWLAMSDAGWGWRSSGGLWHANAAQLLVADSSHGATTAQVNAGASPSKQNNLLAPSFEWEDVWRKNVTDMSTRFVTGDVITVELDLFATGPRGRGVLCFRKNGELLPNLFSGLVSSLKSEQSAQQPIAATTSPPDAFDLELDKSPTRSGTDNSEDEFFFGVTLFGEGDRVRVRRARALESEWAERSSQLSMTRVARAAVTAQRWVRAWRARRAAWELALNAPCVTGVGRPGERHPSLAERVSALALTIAFAQRLQNRRVTGSGGVLEFGGSGDGYAASPPFCLSDMPPSPISSEELCLQYTLELWIKPLPTGNEWIAVAGRPNSANANERHIERVDNMQLWLKHDGAIHHAFGRDGGLTTQPNVVRWGVWTHVALVNNGREAITFVNGESVAQCLVNVDDDSQAALFNANADGAVATPGSFLPSSPCAIVVGGAGTNVGRPSNLSPAVGDTSMCYRGQMSDLRLWQTARSPQQVLCSMRQRLNGAEEGLMGYWPCSTVSEVGQDASNRGRALRIHGAVGANQLNAPEAVFPFERGVPCVPTSTPAATAGHEMSAFALGPGGSGGILHCIATDEGRVAWRHPCMVSHTDTGTGGITVTRSSHGLGDAADFLSLEGVECSTAACAPDQGPQWFMVDLGERFRARDIKRYAMRHGHHQGSGTETRGGDSLMRRGSTRGPDGVWRATPVLDEQTPVENVSGTGDDMALEDVRKIEPISSWQLLASADGRTWITLDQRTRNNSLAVAVAQRFVMTRARDGYGEASWDCRFMKKKRQRAKERLDRALEAQAALKRVDQGQQFSDAAEAQAQLDETVEDAKDGLQGIEAEAAAAANTLFRYFCVLRLEGNAKAAAASAAMARNEAQAVAASKSSGRKRRVGGGSLSRQGGAASAAAAQAGTPLALSGFELYGHLVDLSIERDLQTQFIDWQRQTIQNKQNWQEQETRRQEIQQAELEAHRHRLQLKEQQRTRLEAEEKAHREQQRAIASVDGMVSNPLAQDSDTASAQQSQEESQTQPQASIRYELPPGTQSNHAAQQVAEAGSGPSTISSAHEVPHDLPAGPPPQNHSGPKGIPHQRTASGQRNVEQLAGLGAEVAQRAIDRRESGSFRSLGTLGNTQVPRPSLAPPTAARGPSLRRAGWLFKKGSGSRLVSRRNWKKRYCRIVTENGDGGGGPMLKYFSSPADLVPKGTFALAGCVVEAVENRNHVDVFCFDIIAASKTGRTLSLYSESEDVRSQWLACLRHVIAGKLLPQANSDGLASGTPRSPVTPAGAASDVLEAHDDDNGDELVSTADAEAATTKIMRERQRARAFTSSEVKITRSVSRPSTVAALNAQGRTGGEEDLGLDYERGADGHVLVTGVRSGSLLSSSGKVRIGDVLSAINGKSTVDVDDATLQQLLASTSLTLTLERQRVLDGLTEASRKALAGFDLAPQASGPPQPTIATRVQPAPTEPVIATRVESAPTIVKPSPLGEPRQVTLTKSPMGLGLSFVTADIKNIPGWTGRGVIEVDGTVPSSPAAAAENAGQLFQGDVIAAVNGNPVVAKHNATEKLRLPGEHDFESFSNALRSMSKGESVVLTLRSGPNRTALSPPTAPRLSVAELAAGAAKQRLSVAKAQAKEKPLPTRAAQAGSVADMAAAAARRLSQARERSISDKIKDQQGKNNAAGHAALQRRKFSVMSSSALETLQMLEQQFHARLKIEVEVVEKDLNIPHEVAGDFDCAARCYDNATLSAAYNALAQVHGRLDRFQAEKIDSVEVGQLTSGQQEARMRRQALNRAADALRERIERIIAHVIEPGRELLSSAAPSGSVVHKPVKSSARVSVVHDLPPGPPPPAAVERAAVVDSAPVHVSSGLTVPHDLPPGPPPPLVATSVPVSDLPPPPTTEESARITAEWERAQQARLDAERIDVPPPPPSADELPSGPPPIERADSYRSVEPGNGLPVAAPPTLSRMQRARSVARGDDPSGAAPGGARLRVQRERKASMAELAADRRQAGGMGARRPSVDESTFSFNSSPPPQDHELPRGPPPQA